jgi:hypothetical protein
MSINLDTNDIVRMFQVRATAEPKRELDEVKWWEDRVRRGLVKREHVERYIQALIGGKPKHSVPFIDSFLVAT